MKTKLVFILTSLIIGSIAQAQISKETYTCQKAIAKAVQKFADKVADRIESCLIAVQKCNQKDPGDVDTCVGGLLVAGKGRCAVGKLSGDSNYFGKGSAAANDPSQGLINRELDKFVKGLGKCDLNNTNFGDLNMGNFGAFSNPVPANHFELADALNGDPDAPGETAGAACLAHNRLRKTFPNFNNIVNQIGSHDSSTEFPEVLVNNIVFSGIGCQ